MKQKEQILEERIEALEKTVKKIPIPVESESFFHSDTIHIAIVTTIVVVTLATFFQLFNSKV